MMIAQRLMLAAATALGLPSVIHANTALIARAPVVSLSAWTDGVGRLRFTFETPGATLRGYRYLGTRRSRVTILFFNGSGNTVNAEGPRYRALVAQNAEVVAVDYRGYGFSSGTPDMEAFARDGVALYDSLARQGPVIVYGYSLGTAIATQVAAQRHVPAVILAAPIASAQEEVAAYLAASHSPADALARLTIAPDAHAAFDEAAHVADLATILLVIHGTDDTNVPIAQGREVFNAAHTVRKSFLPLPGYGHGGIVDAPASLLAVRELVGDFGIYDK